MKGREGEERPAEEPRSGEETRERERGRGVITGSHCHGCLDAAWKPVIALHRNGEHLRSSPLAVSSYPPPF